MTDIRTKTPFCFLATNFLSSFQFFFLSFLFPSLFRIYIFTVCHVFIYVFIPHVFTFI